MDSLIQNGEKVVEIIFKLYSISAESIQFTFFLLVFILIVFSMLNPKISAYMLRRFFAWILELITNLAIGIKIIIFEISMAIIKGITWRQIERGYNEKIEALEIKIDKILEFHKSEKEALEKKIDEMLNLYRTEKKERIEKEKEMENNRKLYHDRMEIILNKKDDDIKKLMDLIVSKNK